MWRALTEPRLLGQWFGETDMVPRIGSQFHLHPADMPGFNGPVAAKLIEYGEPRRLTMEWRLDRVQTLVIYELQPTPAGSRLTLHQSCFVNQWQEEHREQLEETYEQVLTGRLPAVLDWLAFSEVNLAPPAAAVPAEPAVADEPATRTGAHRIGRGDGRAGTDRPAGVGGVADQVRTAMLAQRRRTLLLGGAITVVLLMVGVVAVVAFADARQPDPTGDAPAVAVSMNTGPPAEAAGSTGPTTAPTKPPRAVRAEPTATPSSLSPSPTSGSSADTVPLTARYARVSASAFGYRGQITVENPRDGAATGWAVTVTLNGSARVSEASGASFRQDGQTVTFSGAALPAGGSVVIRFGVTGEPAFGPMRPESCAIDGRPCAGL